MRQKFFSFGLGMALALSVPTHATGQTTNWTQAITVSSRLSITAAGGSSSPIFSGDGRSLAFFSGANNLVTNDNRRPWLDLFVHRLETDQTLLAIPHQDGIGGGEASVYNASLSADATRIAFSSLASDLAPNAVTNNLPKVLVRDLRSNTTTCLSINLSNRDETWRNSRHLAISQNGRYLLFQSRLIGLGTSGPITEYNNGYSFIYLRDLESNAIHLVSQFTTNSGGDVNGFNISGSMSADGKYVAYAGYPVYCTACNNRREIYVRDMEANTNACISTQIARVWPQWGSITNRFHSYNPRITPDGRYVVFNTVCYNGELWHYDRLSDAITLITTNTVVKQDLIMPAGLPMVSDNGQVVICDNGTNLFAWDARTVSNQVVDVSLDGVTPGNGIATHASISPDGSKIIFVSNSTNLVPQTAGLTNGSFQVYLRDLTLGITHLLSTNALGQFNGDYSACYPVLSPDGTLVAFDSDDDSLVAGDFNHDSDVFTKNLLTGEIRLISRALDGTSSATALGSVYGPSISLSRDGRYVAFTATDGEIVPGDTNGFRDAIVSDLQTGVKTLASVGTDGTPANLDVVDATVSDDGCFVLFTSLSANLFSNQPPQALPGINHLYLRDLQSTTTVLVASNDAASTPALSPDGRYVAFASKATNLVDYVAITNGSNYLNVYLYDVQARTNILVSLHPTVPDGGLGHSRNPRFTPDSQWLVFDSTAPGLDPSQTNAGPSYLYLCHISSRSNRLTTAATSVNYAFATAFDGSSRLLAYQNPTGITVRAMISNTNLTSYINGEVFRPALGMDGSWLAYYKINNSVFSPGVYLKNLTNYQRLKVAGFDNDLRSMRPLQIGGDDRYLVIVTTNAMVETDNNVINDIFVFDVQQSNWVLLTSAGLLENSSSGSMLPTLSRDGRNLFFRTFAPDMVTNDWNGGGDWVAMQLTSNLVDNIARPIIAWQPASQINVDGATTELTVAVTSGANVFYQWWKNGVLLTNDARLTGANAAALRFSPLLATDGGGYSVVVSNAYGCQTSSVATLTVIHPPFALQGLALGSGTNGQQMTFGLQSMPGRTYQLLARPDLATGEWLPEGLAISATGEVLWFNFYLGTNRQRYFKVQEGP